MFSLNMSEVVNEMLFIILFLKTVAHYIKSKPQDILGEFYKKILDLQKEHEIITKHHQTFMQLFWMTYCNAMLHSGKLSLCT